MFGAFVRDFRASARPIDSIVIAQKKRRAQEIRAGTNAELAAAFHRRQTRLRYIRVGKAAADVGDNRRSTQDRAFIRAGSVLRAAPDPPGICAAASDGGCHSLVARRHGHSLQIGPEHGHTVGRCPKTDCARPRPLAWAICRGRGSGLPFADSRPASDPPVQTAIPDIKTRVFGSGCRTAIIPAVVHNRRAVQIEAANHHGRQVSRPRTARPTKSHRRGAGAVRRGAKASAEHERGRSCRGFSLSDRARRSRGQLCGRSDRTVAKAIQTPPETPIARRHPPPMNQVDRRHGTDAAFCRRNLDLHRPCLCVIVSFLRTKPIVFRAGVRSPAAKQAVDSKNRRTYQSVTHLTGATGPGYFVFQYCPPKLLP